MREIKKRIIAILDSQERKGIETYGHTLEDADPKGWNWDKMTIEELIDALQYQVKENLLLEDTLKEAQAVLDDFSTEIDELREENRINEQVIDNLIEKMEILEDKN